MSCTKTFAITLLVILVCFNDFTSSRIILRSKRASEIEREGPIGDQVVIIKDINGGGLPSNTGYDLEPKKVEDEKKDEEVDLNIDEDDGRFSFGGRLPDFHHFHGSFSNLFDILQRRFEDMTRQMTHSFSSFGDTDVSELPDNYNNTKKDIVTINGRQFIKKETVIKKGSPGAQIFIKSISYVPVPDESENIEPASEVDNTGVSASTKAPLTSESGLEVEGSPV